MSLPKKTMENGTLHMTVMVTKVGESPWSGKGMSLKETSVTKYAPPREEEINLLRMTNEVGQLAERYIIYLSNNGYLAIFNCIEN